MRNSARLLEINGPIVRGVVPASATTKSAGNYSFYDEFPECRFPSFDQGKCFSCWAMAVASVLSHRFCRATGKRVMLMPFHPVYCAPERRGCNFGGHEHLAWRYAEYTGFVKMKKNRNLTCEVPNRTRRYRIEHGSVSTFVGEDEIREEIRKNGPVTGLVYLTEDLYSYGGGIYENEVAETYDQLHTVEIVGWGEENGKTYWIVQNSFGNEWGENGTVRILRGRNELGIESYATAGVPDLVF